MKGLTVKSLVIVAASVFIIAAEANTASAQKRGGGGSGNHSSGSSRGFQGGSGGYQGGSHSYQGSSGAYRGGSGGQHSYQGGSRGFQGGSRGYYPGGYRGGNLYAGQRNRISLFRSHVNIYGRGYSRPYFGGHSRFFYGPHIGLSLRILPFGYYPFYFGNTQFYYSEGLYYRQYNDNYQVVVPPVGAEVPSIPAEAEQVTINGQTYYEYKGVYYNAVENNDGKTVYVIAGKDGVLNTPGEAADSQPALQVGDEVDVLPQNVREVMLKGEKYYVSEDGVYYEEVPNGDKTTYRVVGL
jgi:hypothetical protein